MLKWVVRGNPAPKGSCTPEFYRKYLDITSLNSLEAKSEGYLTDGSCYGSEEEEEDDVFFNHPKGTQCILEDSNNNSMEDFNVMNNKFKCGFIRGSDPLLQTARGKHQNRRSKLNTQINRELRLRAGAENLHKATGNKRLRENVALELRLVNSNLQLLKEELAELNSSVDIYQNDGSTQCVPMIPLGLKETNDVRMELPFTHFILEHYREDAAAYQHQINTFMELRQASRTPMRNDEGVELLFNYYNHLYFVDKRFFPPSRGLGVHFEWYDSLTGIPCSQKTVGFEKGAVLFNIGALYTQIGAKQDRTKPEGISTAAESFQKAAGAFKYLQENFSNAPSMDMQPKTLEMLAQLMLAQSQECMLEKAMLDGVRDGLRSHLDVAQEAAMLAQMYTEVHTLMSTVPVKDYVPFSWITMVEVKGHYFRALAHYHVSLAVLDQPDSDDVEVLGEHFVNLHVHEVTKSPQRKAGDSSRQISVASHTPKDAEERKTFAKAHLHQAILCHEDAMRAHSLSKQLRQIDTFQDVLKQAHDSSMRKFSELEDEDDFTELLSAPHIRARSKEILHSIPPDFSAYKVEDLFHELGPLAIFSAHHSWSNPRCVDMKREEGQEYGFSVRGESPIIIALVEDGTLAQKQGVKVGDFIIGVGEQDIKWQKHDEVVGLIKAAGNHLVLKLITPTDRNYLEPCQSPASMSSTPSSEKHNGSHQATTSSKSESSSSQGLFKRRAKGAKKSGDSTSIWTLKRRGKAKENKRADKCVMNSTDNDMHGR